MASMPESRLTTVPCSPERVIVIRLLRPVLPCSHLRQAVQRVVGVGRRHPVRIRERLQVPNFVVRVRRRARRVHDRAQTVQRVVGVGVARAIRVRRCQRQQIARIVVGIVQRSFGRLLRLQVVAVVIDVAGRPRRIDHRLPQPVVEVGERNRLRAEARVRRLRQQAVVGVVGVGGGLAVEVHLGLQIARGVVGIALRLPRRQLARSATAQVVVPVGGGVLVGVGLRDAIAHFVVAVAGHQVQPALHGVLRHRGQPCSVAGPHEPISVRSEMSGWNAIPAELALDIL